MNLYDVYLQAKELSAEDRKELVKMLVDLIAEDNNRSKRSLHELRGLGKGIWQGIDAQDYINELRDEWDRDR